MQVCVGLTMVEVEVYWFSGMPDSGSAEPVTEIVSVDASIRIEEPQKQRIRCSINAHRILP